MHREVKPNRFEIPKPAKVVIWAIVGLVALWLLAAFVTVTFFPGLYR
jgi:membrane protein YdbS with pleckstrin-like domain